METAASFEARFAPSSYPTENIGSEGAALTPSFGLRQKNRKKGRGISRPRKSARRGSGPAALEMKRYDPTNFWRLNPPKT